MRNATLLIPYPLLMQARLAAELDGLDCAETFVQMTLQKAIDARPELSDLFTRIEKAKAQARKEWRTAHNLDKPTT